MNAMECLSVAALATNIAFVLWMFIDHWRWMRDHRKWNKEIDRWWKENREKP